MSNHTPGPWMIDPPIKGQESINVWEQSGIGHVAAVSTGLLPDPSAEANARLIASAPCLLEAVKLLMAIIGPKDSETWANDDEIDAAWEAGESAIAKATGKDTP